MTGRRKREPLLCGYWINPETGRKLHRASRDELREANRLWWTHRDLRERKRARTLSRRRTPLEPLGELRFVPFAGAADAARAVREPLEAAL